MKKVTIHEAESHLSSLLKEVEAGQEIIITRAKVPIAKLVRVETARRERKLGSAKGQIVMAPDFDEPLPDWAPD